MPSLGADMDAGTILEWRVKPGDEVHRGDIVAVVDTEKSDIEVEVFEDGVVEELLVEPGREVAVGTPLARITSGAAPAEAAPAKPKAMAEAEAEAPARPKAKAEAPARAPRKAAPKPARTGAPKRPKRVTAPAGTAPRPAAVPPAAGERVRSSPLARRRAAELGVDLHDLAGSGQGGAVLAADLAVTTPAPPAPATPAPAPHAPTERTSAERQALMRHAIAELMARSAREIPHYYLATTVDLSRAVAWLVEENARRPITERVLPAALLLKATALAAREVPALNGFWHDGFEPAPAVHLGVAVSLRGGGLLAPAIHDADQLSLDDMMRALRDLVERARAGRLRSSEMSDPTLTVTNLGDQGADEVHGVIYAPQVALVGFGRILDRPWASGGMLGVRPTVRATLAADHRASDGHEGSRLLAAIDRLLQAPEAL
jgi:pyruvate dehydrogenase E2 component (dihydrolipoamide acetyltransferase)